VKVLRGLVKLGQERAQQRQLSDLPSLDGWFHETLAQASGSTSLAQLLTQLRHKLTWVYSVELPMRAEESWGEHAAIADAVARGDTERARRLAALPVERSAAAYRLRRMPRQSGRSPKGTGSASRR
jgi:DNA-binding GntR family transcriptional regulator